MITGYLCLVAVLLLLMKFVVRKIGWKKGDSAFHKIHKPLGIAVIVIFLLHMVLTFPVWDTRSLFVIGSGILLSGLIIFMAVTFLLRKKFAKKWMKWHRTTAVLIVIALATHIITYYIDFFSYQNDIECIALNAVSADGVADGSYIGEYDVGYIYAKVRVDVSENQIVDIKILEHDNERGTPAEAILSEIVKEQTTGVDAVSGATNSSKVLKKAVENALEKGRQ